MEHYYAAGYSDLESWHWWFRGRERILESVVSHAFARTAPDGPRRILSVGCGPPSGLTWLLPFTRDGGTVIGLDADPSGALREAANGNAAPPGVAFVAGTLERPPMRPRSVSAVLALDVIEHLDDDVEGLRGVAALVAPGGFLMVTVPALPSLWGRQDTVSHHRRRYTMRTLADSFARAGLERPRLTYFNTLLFPPIAAVRWTRRLLRAKETGSDAEMSRPGVVNGLLAKVFAAERFVVPRARLPFGVSLLAMLRMP
jgi:SAM-dependent methyltransferase